MALPDHALLIESLVPLRHPRSGPVHYFQTQSLNILTSGFSGDFSRNTFLFLSRTHTFLSRPRHSFQDLSIFPFQIVPVLSRRQLQYSCSRLDHYFSRHIPWAPYFFPDPQGRARRTLSYRLLTKFGPILT